MAEKVSLPGPGRRQIAIMVAFLTGAALFIFFLWRGLHSNPMKVPSVLVNKQAHPFTASWLQGQEFVKDAPPDAFQLDTFKGRPMILNFWASWCYSCRAEARDFENFWQMYKDKGVAVVGIAIQDTPTAALQFARTYGKTYILGLDSDDGKAAIDYGVTGVPETFFIDRNGVIVHKEAGPVTAEVLARYTDELLR